MWNECSKLDASLSWCGSFQRVVVKVQINLSLHWLSDKLRVDVYCVFVSARKFKLVFEYNELSRRNNQLEIVIFL